MKKTLTTIFLACLLLFLIFNGHLAAQKKDEMAIQRATQEIGDYIAKILDKVIDWILGLLLAIASLFILLAAYKFLTAGGNEDQIKEARNMIWYAVLALVVGLLSQFITYLVKTIFEYQ